MHGSLPHLYRCLAALVEAAGLWKAETIGDAYLVVATGESDAPPVGWAELSRAAVVSEPGGVLSRDGAVAAAAAAAARLRGRFQLEAVFALADRMLAELAGLRERAGLPIHCRIGIHTGSVVTGLIGSKRPRYCVVGTALIEAERVQHAGGIDRVTCSGAVRELYDASLCRFAPVDVARSTPAAPSRVFDVTGPRLGEDRDQ